MKKLEQHPEVAREIEDWALILAEKSERAPFAFVAEVRAAFRRIQERPAHAHFVYKHFRRFNLRRFSHAVIYREKGDAVYIIAVMHEKRHPDYWKHRVSDDA